MATSRACPVTWTHMLSSVCVFFGWTVTSFLCHECGKMFLRQSTSAEASKNKTDDEGGEFSRLGWALLLTAVQCVTCLLLVRRETNEKKGGWSRAMLVLLSTHFLATLCTNYSMAYIEAASTFAIKLTEPVTMAIGHHLVFLSPVPIQTMASIPLIVAGVLVFSGPAAHSIPGSTGLVLAFASNVILTARNIALKKMQPEEQSASTKFTLRSARCVAMTLLCDVFVLSVMGGLVAQGSLSVKTWWLAALVVASGLFHVAYSYISTNVVLKIMNVVSHSIANIFKRILVVLLLYACGQHSASGSNFLGLLLAVIGVFIYVQGKTRASTLTHGVTEGRSHTSKQSRRNIFIALGVLTTTSLMTVATTGNYSEIADVSLQSINQTNLQPYEIPWLKIALNQAPKIKPNTAEFLSWRLVDHPEETDIRAKTLTTNKEVVQEAQRILMNLLRDLLGGARHVMLMEIATYENKGDPAIATGEIMLLRKMNVSIVFYCTTSSCLQGDTMKHALEVSQNYTKDDLVILMQGGGNLVGYAFNDHLRKKILNTFPDRRSILFSQSIWLNHGNMQHLKTCQEIYSNRSNLVIFLRDRQSLAIAKTYFKGTKLILAPDLAFAIGMTPRQMVPIYDILWLRRGDGESSKYELPIFPPDLRVHVADWWGWKSNKGSEDMETCFLITAAGFQFLQRGRIVVTDRLHGHILSTLMNIPHVLIDNPPFFKLSSFDTSWTAGLRNTILISNISLALDAARWLLRKYDSSLPLVGPIDMDAIPR